MKLSSNPDVKAELDNLQTQFGNKAYLDMDDYADLYKIDRRYASRHARRRDMPITKEGRGLYISMLDLAIYKVRCKTGKSVMAEKDSKNEMKRRRGFSQAAERKALGA